MPGIEPTSPMAPVLADDLFTTVPHGKPTFNIAVAKLYNMVLIFHVMQMSSYCMNYLASLFLSKL